MSVLAALVDPGYYLLKMHDEIMDTPYTVGLFDGKAMYTIGSMLPVNEEDLAYVSPDPIDLNAIGATIEHAASETSAEIGPTP